jgi:hypothetical protein
MEDFKNEGLSEKLAGMSDDQIKGMVEDPIGTISTKEPGAEDVWSGMNEDDMKTAAKNEAEKRGL